jgi:hypothetical protein
VDQESGVRTYLSSKLFSYDIITDFMITHSPSYLLPYRYISLSQGSDYMSDEVYQKLIKDRMNQANVPFQPDDRFYKNAGIKNEPGKARRTVQ